MPPPLSVFTLIDALMYRLQVFGRVLTLRVPFLPFCDDRSDRWQFRNIGEILLLNYSWGVHPKGPLQPVSWRHHLFRCPILTFLLGNVELACIALEAWARTALLRCIIEPSLVFLFLAFGH